MDQTINTSKQCKIAINQRTPKISEKLAEMKEKYAELYLLVTSLTTFSAMDKTTCEILKEMESLKSITIPINRKDLTRILHPTIDYVFFSKNYMLDH